ncbi:MAG TPA: MFS transporter, partial [Opitutales bacterium]|nr:MFS transporter [Opitutales bacterium]
PFKPRHWVFYYGWAILVVATIGHMAAIPGQTGGITGFINPLQEALGLSEIQLSLAYMIGTLGAASLLPWAGRIYDRYGARLMGTLVFGIFGLVFFYLASMKLGYNWLKGTATSSWTIGMGLVIIGFFGLRFLGMGILSFLPRTMLSKWFHKKRGLTNALSGTCVALGSGSAPLVSSILVGNLGWELSWLTLGLIYASVLMPLAWLMYRDTPESCHLPQDGFSNSIKTPPITALPTLHEYTLAEAMRTRTFWLFALGIALNSALTTSVNFHAQSIEANLGMPMPSFMELFVPISCINVGVSALASWLSMRIALKYLLISMMGLQTVGFVGLWIAPNMIGINFFVVGFGAAFGLYTALMICCWPILFGRLNLGAISGFALAINLFSTSVGPLIFSLSKAWTNGYTAAYTLVIILSLNIAWLARRADSPQGN